MKSLSPNTLLQNRYLIVNLIGKGGMGEVYLATDQRLGNHVALKRTFFTDDEILAVAFEREARTLANLRHKALTKVSDHFNENGEQFLVMEYISGEDLTKRLQVSEKPFPMNWVLFWADELLDALAYLHSQDPQIIHRDIKPQNLKLTSDNHVILLDFGLAKNSNGQAQSSTSGGSIVGYTPHYAPMEQIRSTGTSPKSDIYSLSATLYQLMTNIVPPDALSRADELLNGRPDCVKPLNLLNAEVPISISNVILKGMAFRSDDRFSDAREMQLALREAYANQKTDEVYQTNEVVPQSQMKTEQFVLPIVNEQIVEPQLDFNATMRIDSSSSIGDKTEVMSGFIGDKTELMPSSFNGATEVMPTSSNGKTEVMPTPNFEKTEIMPIPSKKDEEVIPIGEKTEIMPNFPMVEQTPIDGSTVPFINFENQASFAETNQTFDSDFQESPQTEQFQSFASVYEQPEEETSFEPTPVAAVIKPKNSSSKMFAILGIVGLFGVLAIGGGGTALYMFNNKEAATPTPKATPKIETPTPEPTVEIKTDTNVNAGNVANVGNMGSSAGNAENLSSSNTTVETKKTEVKTTTNPTPVVNNDKPKSTTQTPVPKTVDTPTPSIPKLTPPTTTTKTPAPLTPPKTGPTPKKVPTVKPEIY
jgi:serine/threonine protein kinase